MLTGVDHTMKIMTEETFGPTLPIMKVRDADEAVRLANDSRYGLNSSVFTKDIAKGERIARRLEAGNACVNDALMNYLALEAPFGGASESGLGARHGAPGIRKYCATQTILMTRFGAKREPTMFPNKALTAKVFERLMVLMWGRGGGSGSRDRGGTTHGMRAAAVRVDSNAAGLRAARWLRSRLPGDARFGDPLSTAGSAPVQVLGREVSALEPPRPSAAHELGLGRPPALAGTVGGVGARPRHRGGDTAVHGPGGFLVVGAGGGRFRTPSSCCAQSAK